MKIKISDMFWIASSSEKATIGFTSRALQELGQIWNILPRIENGQSFVAGQAIATVETTTQLKSLIIPINGVLIDFNAKVSEKPEEIDENTTIFSVRINNAMQSL